MNGGDRIAEVLAAHGVRFLFTLCGGHISPILVAAKARGVRVIDVRHEANAVFAADAVARLGGVPGVAAVTAGPGLTNSVTAVKNASLAESPIVILGGATATLLRGRGSLQDIDQKALMAPHVKRVFQARRVRDLAPLVSSALDVARSGVPGPVFVECPVDLLYNESQVRAWYGAGPEAKPARGLKSRAVSWRVQRHIASIFAADRAARGAAPLPAAPRTASAAEVSGLAARLRAADRPLLLAGSQALADPTRAAAVRDGIRQLGVPCYLSGMARGLLGASDPLQLRHRRREALRQADLVLLAGVACDFRLDYGRQIPRSAVLAAVNRSRSSLYLNRRPQVPIHADPGRLLAALAEATSPNGGANGGPAGRWDGWRDALRRADLERDDEIRAGSAAESPGGINPLRLLGDIDGALAPESIVVADGGDFVATASYIVRPRGPLSWLDPGPFGTLGVGAGFALGAKLCRPQADVWLLWGDGSAAFSLMEFDTFVRHGIGILAVVGNDASWAQIAREQVHMLGDDVGTVLRPTDYDAAAAGLGGHGVLLTDVRETTRTLHDALGLARQGKPVLVNARLGATEFRKGSLSM